MATEPRSNLVDLRRRLIAQPAIPGEDHARIIDQDRMGETEPFNAGRELPDLKLGVGPRIA